MQSEPDAQDRSAPWWHAAVIYQIYPRSFRDANGDGIGDLAGVVERLDHLRWLGVDAIWLCPIYPSPMVDFGYDIDDFCGVDPTFGTLADFDRLLAAAHDRGIRIVLDFVPNHTSDQHPWFRESRRSRDDPKREWYVWRDPRDDGTQPNGWRSTYGEPAWGYDPATGQFYYHVYLAEQPDLNWRNPAVRDAMHGVMRFWLCRGVDGFRVDGIQHLVEDDLLREDPPADLVGGDAPGDGGVAHIFTADRPETHAEVGAFRRLVDEFGDRVLIGEAHLPVAQVMRYYGVGQPGFHLPFNFLFLRTAWDARAVEAAIDRYCNLLPDGAWPNWVLGNHDERRIASRIGQEQARVAAMLAFTVGGTPFVYNGDELGLEDVTLERDATRDTAELRFPGQGYGRDPQRTPMPWDGSPNAGFTDATPWLPIGDANARRHVEAQKHDPRSMLSLYRRLIELRRAEPALVYGGYRAQAEQGDVLAYVREGAGKCFFVALNFGSKPEPVSLPPGRGRLVLSTLLDRNEECAGTIRMRANEGVIIRIA